MATDPAFAATPAFGMVQISTANTNRNGTGSLGIVKSAGANGSRVDLIRFCSAGTTTAGVVRIYISDGTNHRLVKEIMVTAVTPSTTIEVWNGEYRSPEPIVIASGDSIRASTNNAETFNVFAFGADL